MLSKIFGGSPPPEADPPATPAPAPSPEPDAERAAALAAEEQRLEAALASGDEAAVAPFVLEGASTRIRQRAAQAIQSPERVRELIRAARGGRDNAVYRILTATRDAQLKAEREVAQRQAELEATIAAIARHAHHVYEPMYEATLTGLEQRWHALAAGVSADLQAAVAADLAACHAIAAAHRAQAGAEQRAREEAQAAAERERAEREAEASAQAEAQAGAEAARAQAEAEGAAQRAAAQAEREAVAGAHRKLARELTGQLRQLQAALDHGGSARAARLRSQLAAKLADAPAEALPAWFPRQLEAADEKLARLKDWHAYTVAPKRAELIERMRSLVGAEIAPEQLAQHIRKLQQEWRTLHRGAGEDDGAESQRFRDLGHQAWEPCKVHFAAQAAQRAGNLAQRESILARLAAFTAAQAGQPDFRLIAQVQSEARREWQKHAPVDQDIAESLQARLRAALEALGAPLEAEYARNVAAKRALIEQAGALVALPDVRAAIAGAKDLQRRWQEVGIVPRSKDNALWEAFRGHCNAVFERSAQEAAAHASALSGNATRAEEIIAEATRVAALSGTGLREALSALEPLMAEFEALELPRAGGRELHQRYQRAIRQCEEAARADREQSAGRARSVLFEAAAAIRNHVAARAQGDCAERVAGLQADVEAALAAIAQAPKTPRSVIEKHWARVAGADPAHDARANEAAFRLLCIRAELAADQPTPAEDQDRRREYQMQRLLASRNLGAGNEPDTAEGLALEWFVVGPVAPGVEEALRARFERCRGGIGQRRR